jgi:hypothetical protein
MSLRPLRAFVISLLLSLAVSLAPHAQAQVRPATITSVAPAGAQRGTTVSLTIEGANLAGASAIRFGHAGLKGTILNVIELPFQPVFRPKGFTGAPIEDRFALHRVLARVEIAESAPAGTYSFRLQTPLGTTNAGSLTVGTLVEIPEAEPNNTIAEAHRIFFPSTIVGTIARPADEDIFEFQGEPGRTVVFEVQAAVLGSAADTELTLLDPRSKVVARNNDANGKTDSLLAYTLLEPGFYRLRVTDAVGGGSARHFYRINVGELPYLTRVFPLGVRAGSSVEVALDGYNVPPTLRVDAPAAGAADTLLVEPRTRGRAALDPTRIAVGSYPEIAERENNDTPNRSQSVTLPVTVNGTIDSGGAAAKDQDVFRVRARKGDRIAMTVAAQRLGSPLDAVLEVLDADGQVLPRAVARPVWQTSITLNDPGSIQRGIRLESWTGLRIGDLLMFGNEIAQVEDLPKNPDDDIKFRSYRGARIGYEGTTPEAHAMNTPVYKVELHKPGKTFPPNGMPLLPIAWRNDDGGQDFGKDSFLLFEAPSDGDVFVRIRDIRGEQGKNYAYRLTLAAPEPDFTLTVDPRNPNVPRGSAIPVTVTASRLDGFDGAIDVELVDLPEGLSAAPGRILPGASTVVLALRAAPDARLKTNFLAFRARGRAQVGALMRERWAPKAPVPGALDDGVSALSVLDAPELELASAEPRELVLEPGGQAAVTVSIARHNGFTGRVPVEVRNLPLGVTVPDIGLNGILITEAEASRTFHVAVDPRTPPGEQQLYLVARIETNASAVEHASLPIRLRVAPKKGGVSQQQ